MYPISKYKFYVTPDNKTIAVSTYAGKTVKGVAKTDPRDNFNADFGKELAAARCAAKVAKKRKARADKCLAKAQAKMAEASRMLAKMEAYYADARKEYEEATFNVVDLETRG